MMSPRYDASLLEIARAAGHGVIEKKARTKATPWEHRDHALLVEKLRLDPYWKEVEWWATPNQGRRSLRAQAQMKREGMSAGVPDLQFMQPLHGFSGLFLELKAPPPHRWELSKPQRERLARLAGAGYCAVVARGEFAAWDALEAYRTGRIVDEGSGCGGFWWRVTA